LETARIELLEAQAQLAHRRTKTATARLYRALDAVWSAQGERNNS
jgi:hypothetical protein